MFVQAERVRFLFVLFGLAYLYGRLRVVSIVSLRVNITKAGVKVLPTEL